MTQHSRAWVPFLGRHLDKAGVVGSVVASLCCLGVSSVVSVVAALGLGFLLVDAMLLPAAVVFLLVTLVGLALGARTHHRLAPLVVGGVAAVALLISAFVMHARAPAYVALAGLVGASIMNAAAQRRMKRGARTSHGQRAAFTR